MIVFFHGCITCKSGKFYMRRDAYKKAPHAFTRFTCGLSMKTGKFACIYAASPSRRIHSTPRDKTGKVKVTPPAECNLTYLQLRVFCLQIERIFACVCGYFCLRLADIFTCDSSVLLANCMYFCVQKQANLHEFHLKITCEIPVIFR